MIHNSKSLTLVNLKNEDVQQFHQLTFTHWIVVEVLGTSTTVDVHEVISTATLAGLLVT